MRLSSARSSPSSISFRDDGLTAYGGVFAALIVWLAHGAARSGTAGLIVANQARRH
jgi:hypothetical protein